MFARFKHLFGGDAPVTAGDSGLALADLGEQIQKLARTQARQTLVAEETAQKLEAGFEDLRGLLRSQLRQAEPGAGRELVWDPLLDALDLLAEAERHAAADSPRFAAGLGGIRSRLEAFLEQAGLTRLDGEGAPADGRLFRVVGTDVRADLPAGSVARVVRAAVRRGDRLVREGEVLVSVMPGQEVKE